MRGHLVAQHRPGDHLHTRRERVAGGAERQHRLPAAGAVEEHQALPDGGADLQRRGELPEFFLAHQPVVPHELAHG